MKKLLLFVFLLSASAVLSGCGEKKEAAMPPVPAVQSNMEYSEQTGELQTASSDEQMPDSAAENINQ